MPKQVLGPNTSVTLYPGGTASDISQYCSSVTVEDTTDDVETTGFSETYKEYLGGLRDCNITMDVFQGYGSGEPNAVITPYRTTAGTIKVNPDTTLTGSSAVVYTMVARAYSFNPVDGGVGDANTTSVTFRNASTAGLTSGTA